MLVGTCCPQQPRKGHNVCQRFCSQALLEYCPQSGRLLIQFAESLLARAGDKVTRGLRYIFCLLPRSCPQTDSIAWLAGSLIDLGKYKNTAHVLPCWGARCRGTQLNACVELMEFAGLLN